MKPLSGKKEPKGHTSMSRPHPLRKNKLRVDKKANRQESKGKIEKALIKGLEGALDYEKKSK